MLGRVHMETDDHSLIQRRKLHKVIVIGEPGPALHEKLGSFEMCNAYAESRIVRTSAEQAGLPLSLAPQGDRETFVWVFVAYRDIGSAVLADVLVQAMETSATFLYVYCESGAEAGSLGGWLPPSSGREKFGVLLTPYTRNDFRGLELFLACTREPLTYPGRLLHDAPKMGR